MIVVERDDLAILAGDFDEGIKRGAEAARIHFRDDCLAGFSFHLEDVPVTGQSMRPLTMMGRLTFCALDGSSLGSLSRHSSSVSRAKGT